MIVSLAISTQDERTPSPEWVGGLAQLARAVEPVKLADHSHRLPTADDVRAAARHRLRAWTAQQIGQGLEAVAEMLPALDAGTLDSHDRLGPWTACCALAVLHADKVGDVATFWSAGSEVMDAYRQAQRARYERTMDALGARVIAYLAEGITEPAEIWRDLRRIAEEGGDVVIDEFEDGLLRYQARPGDDDLTSITFTAFRRRVQRLGVRLSGSV